MENRNYPDTTSKVKNVSDLIQTAERNPKGTVGVLAGAAVAVVLYAINVISKK